MAGSSKQKKKLAVKMAMYFAELGYVCNPREFSRNNEARPELVKTSTIKKIFGSWSMMTKYTRSFCPELMQGLTNEKPKAVDPLVELQAKTAKAENEGDDGEDI